MFVVVKAMLDYDYLPKDGITYVAKFDSKELAEAYVSSIEEKYGKWCKEKKELIDTFVNTFDLPSPLSMDKWKEIVDNLDPVFRIERPPCDTNGLRSNIIQALWNGRKLKNFDIQVGQRPECHTDLFIFEMKDME